MRKDEIRDFAKKLRLLEEEYSVDVISDNYFTPAVIVDIKGQSGFSYQYYQGDIKLDTNTYKVGSDEEN
ncbi:hypothetical protein [Paraliobacillus sediminis]|uniref:hypothetical protein n=1 Tax=Paraliobacillus sediminis TaxID=1885916 RepID=UPI000E3B908D|nr:hypothetical protein [Paraliobacillus sediminis]